MSFFWGDIIQEDNVEEALKRTLERGIGINNVDSNGYPCITYVATKGSRELLLLLLNLKADVNHNIQGMTPLICCATNGHTNMMGLLLDNNANIHHVDSLGRTILHYAVGEREGIPRVDLGILKLLFQYGAMRNLNLQDRYKETPLDWTMSNKEEYATEFLLDKGAKMTPLCSERPWIVALATKRRQFRQSYAVAYGLLRRRIKAGKDMTGVISSMIYASRFDEMWGK
jgi:ankyrin repeat protein